MKHLKKSKRPAPVPTKRLRGRRVFRRIRSRAYIRLGARQEFKTDHHPI